MKKEYIKSDLIIIGMVALLVLAICLNKKSKSIKSYRVISLEKGDTIAVNGDKGHFVGDTVWITENGIDENNKSAYSMAAIIIPDKVN